MGEGIDGESSLAAAPYDRWFLLRPAEGSPRPSARYKHAAEVVQDKLYMVGGSRNGRYLSDVQVFDFRTFKWSVFSPTRDSNQLNLENNATDRPFPALVGHSLVKWKNNIVVVAGNTRASSSNKVSDSSRMAGQFAKPRSDSFEERDGVKLPSYRGDNVNGDVFGEKSHVPDPQRMIRAYAQSVVTLNLLRAFATGGYAAMQRVTQWNLDFMDHNEQGDR